MKKISTPLLALAISLTLSGCAKSYLVLMEDHDGSTGKVMFKDASGETLIDQAGYAAVLSDAKNIFKPEQQQIESDFNRALSSEPTRPDIFLLYFNNGGTVLTEESAALIPKIFDAAAAHPAADISVIGHTDTVGDAEKNEKLANERAIQVSHLLEQTTLDVKELVVTSHGEKNLLVKTADEVAEPKNRRVEVTIR